MEPRLVGQFWFLKQADEIFAISAILNIPAHITDPGSGPMRMMEEERRSRLVFVDPEDETLPYWWPALLVPSAEFEIFRETMDSDTLQPSSDERLVCYFEDGSFSVVPSTAMVPFSPDKEPFVSYAKNIKRFGGDLGVMRAVRFWGEGIIPDGFKWLKLLETGFVEPEEPVSDKMDDHLTDGRAKDAMAKEGKVKHGKTKEKMDSRTKDAMVEDKARKSTNFIEKTDKRTKSATRGRRKTVTMPRNEPKRSKSGNQVQASNTLPVILSTLPTFQEPKVFEIISHLLPSSVRSAR